VLLALGVCYGSVVIDLGSDGRDTRPIVVLAISADVVTQAGPLTLIASVSDDHAVDHVEFFQLDPEGASVRLGQVDASPYRWTLSIDRRANGQQYFFARAVDDAGQSADSAVVSVQVSIP